MKKADFYQHLSPEGLREILRENNAPCFLYFAPFIRKRIAAIRATLPEGFRLSFAVKANPNKDVLRLMAEEGLGADVASGGELGKVLAAGIPAERIEFSGPAKSDEELARAVAEEIGSVNVESLEELERLAALSEKAGKVTAVGLRINPGDLSASAGLSMTGLTPFGIGPEEMAQALKRLAALPHLRFAGLHVHGGSQILEVEALGDLYERILEWGLEALEISGTAPEKINFGGGWGVPYFDNQSPLDLTALQEELADLFADERYDPLRGKTRFSLEPGRFLMAENGIYAVQVENVKVRGGKALAITNGGMHQAFVLAGGMGQVIRRDFEWDRLRVPENREGETVAEKWMVTGCLCTPQDVLVREGRLEGGVKRGDWIIFFNLGAYGPSASPGAFLSHPAATEQLLEMPK